MPTFEELVESGVIKKRQSEVYVVMFSNRDKYTDGMTVRDISGWMRYEFTSHSGIHSRLRELAEIGLIQKLGRKRCPISKRMTNVWRVL